MFQRSDGSIKKRTGKVGMRLTILLGGVFALGLYKFMGGRFPGESETDGYDNSVSGTEYDRYSRLYTHRSLVEEVNVCTDPDTQPSICVGYGNEACKRLGTDQMYGIFFICLALLYLFVGIAIVCDELFVPALEIIAEDLKLSNDVAGATLMAAGGSAPELATSFVGVFKRSDVGFGTIVGSAVFNVLFVISMCVMFTPKKFSPLELTWWPLFRDCSYYVLTLATLAAFMYDGVIMPWEAVIQFLLYFGYVFMMSKSEQLEEWVTKNLLKTKEAQVVPGGVEMSDIESAAASAKKGEPSTGDIEKSHSHSNNSKSSNKNNNNNINNNDGKVAVIEKHHDTGSKEHDDASQVGDACFVRPSTFRVGILQLLTQKHSIVDTAGIAFVSKIKGDVYEVFRKLDTNGNGQLDPHELKEMLLELGTPPEELTDAKIDECMAEMDSAKRGYVTKAAFTVWYTGHEQRLRNQTRHVFNKYDYEKKGTISREDVVAFLTDLGHGSKGELELITAAARDIPSTNKDPEYLNYDDFATWYEHSLFWQEDKNQAEQAADAQESMWEGVLSGIRDLADPETPTTSKVNFVITLPLSLLFCLIPDCRPPGMEGRAVATLIGSIIMIALFAVIMVELAEIFGKSLGIPDVVMGLTILAAGTSVPDLLSSVIVAQQGLGDMAVSSSIGSNIFDVAFGLPLPWLVFNIVSAVNGCKCFVEVGSEGLFTSLLILLVMVGAIVVIIHLSGWKMTHGLGYAMFVLYFIYVGISLGITPASEYKADKCSPFDPLG